MEEARRLLAELEALKQQVLARYPDAAAADMSDADGGLPGQVTSGDAPPPPESTAAADADRKSAVAGVVQAELAKQMDALQSQVWREIVREELQRLGAAAPESMEPKSANAPARAESPGTAARGAHYRSREHHSVGDHLHLTSHHHEHSRHHHAHHDGVYNADFVLGPVAGYRQSPRNMRAPSASRQTPRETPRDAGQDRTAEGEGEGKEMNKLASEDGEKANARDDEPKASSADGDDQEGEKGEEEDEEDEEWVSVSENAYGAFIHVGLQSGFKQAVIKCWTMLLVSIVIAIIFSGELIQRHQFFGERLTDKTHIFWVEDRPNICWIPFKLQTAACMIFITLIFNNISGMVEAGRIALHSTHHKFGDGENVGEMLLEGQEKDADEARPLKVPTITRIGIFICAVLTEVITWFMILASGLLFIFTSPTVDLVIRSTVAVMFVLNVDEIVFESCCPGSIKEDVEETKYRIVLPKMSNTTKEIFDHYFGLYVYLPLLLVLSSGYVVFGRNLLECDQSPFWQVPFNESGVKI